MSDIHTELEIRDEWDPISVFKELIFLEDSETKPVVTAPRGKYNLRYAQVLGHPEKGEPNYGGCCKGYQKSFPDGGHQVCKVGEISRQKE